MNIAQALAALRKTLGPKAAIRDNKKASSPEAREVARLERKLITDARDTTRKALEKRRAEILNADAEYCKLNAEAQRLENNLKDAPFPFYRYTGGCNEAWCFRVEGEGDTLAELVETVIERQKKRA